MVIDASAVIAILKLEPERERFSRAIIRASTKLMSPVNWLECAIRVERAGSEDLRALDDFVAASAIVIVPIDQFQMRTAHIAYRDFGKGRHPAALYLGDCFAYALSKATGEPLLYKGADFARTDIVSALA
jgi:ribonuclease VapC